MIDYMYEFQISGNSSFSFRIIICRHISDSYGHGLGSETMPPVTIVMYDGLGDEPFVVEGTLEVNSSTIYTDVDGEEKGIRQISINFLKLLRTLNQTK